MAPSTRPASVTTTRWGHSASHRAGQLRRPATPTKPGRGGSASLKGADGRITCTACHNPHRPLVQDPLAYDARCLSCHVTAGADPKHERPGRACKVGGTGCTACHMPKYEVPEMHHSFTDHLIRVVRVAGIYHPS